MFLFLQWVYSIFFVRIRMVKKRLNENEKAQRFFFLTYKNQRKVLLSADLPFSIISVFPRLRVCVLIANYYSLLQYYFKLNVVSFFFLHVLYVFCIFICFTTYLFDFLLFIVGNKWFYWISCFTFVEFIGTERRTI